MKLLVLAQTPPPLHGQSLMVQTLVDGLPDHGVALHHVNFALSRDATDIGRWRLGKIFSVLRACVRAVVASFAHDCDTLYYVPAPGKRGALYRDWVVMLFCRPFFAKLVLHWHATGLGEWLDTHASAPERALTQLLLGAADLSLALTGSLRDDAKKLRSKRITIIANGIADPESPNAALRPRRPVRQILFLGLCTEEKGLFDLAAAVLEANRQAGGPAFLLTAAGAFPDAATALRFSALVKDHPDALGHAGFVAGEAKRALLQDSDCLVLPTHLPHEGQPLVLLEAMAADLPVIASRWRGIPETLPPSASRLVEPHDVPALVAALQDLRRTPPAVGEARAWFLANYTQAHHLERVAAALRQL